MLLTVGSTIVEPQTFFKTFKLFVNQDVFGELVKISATGNPYKSKHFVYPVFLPQHWLKKSLMENFIFLCSVRN